MKINKKLTAIAICFGLAYQQTTHTFFNDDFEEEFTKKMDEIEKNIQNSFNQFHNKFFRDLDSYNQNLETQTKKISDQSIQLNSTLPENNVNFYQQSTNSLSFSNQDKTIKIIEKKDSQAKIYTIYVTDKRNLIDGIQKPSTQETDSLTELKALQTYMKNTFHAKQAVEILQECINAMSHEQKNKLINIESSTNENQKKYTIEMFEKKDSIDNNIQEPVIKKRHKKKIKK